MQSLILAHLTVHNIDARTLFRAAYMSKFQKDVPPQSLKEDLGDFNRLGKAPPYVIDYMMAYVTSRKVYST